MIFFFLLRMEGDLAEIMSWMGRWKTSAQALVLTNEEKTQEASVLKGKLKVKISTRQFLSPDAFGLQAIRWHRSSVLICFFGLPHVGSQRATGGERS